MITFRCNICGKEFEKEDELNGFALDYFAGQGSRHNGERIQVDFCVKCFDEFVDGIAEVAKYPILRPASDFLVFDDLTDFDYDEDTWEDRP